MVSIGDGSEPGRNFQYRPESVGGRIKSFSITDMEQKFVDFMEGRPPLTDGQFRLKR